MQIQFLSFRCLICKQRVYQVKQLIWKCKDEDILFWFPTLFVLNRSVLVIYITNYSVYLIYLIYHTNLYVSPDSHPCLPFCLLVNLFTSFTKPATIIWAIISAIIGGGPRRPARGDWDDEPVPEGPRRHRDVLWGEIELPLDTDPIARGFCHRGTTARSAFPACSWPSFPETSNLPLWQNPLAIGSVCQISLFAAPARRGKQLATHPIMRCHLPFLPL